jgi:hypothetical protein
MMVACCSPPEKSVIIVSDRACCRGVTEPVAVSRLTLDVACLQQYGLPEAQVQCVIHVDLEKPKSLIERSVVTHSQLFKEKKP